MGPEAKRALGMLLHKYSQLQERMQRYTVLCSHQMKIIQMYRERRRRLRQRIAILHQHQHKLLQLLADPPREWQKERSSLFWEHDVAVGGEAAFKKHFRMSRGNFKTLCSMLTGLQRNDTRFRRAIPYEKRIAIAVYSLGSSARYKVISKLFGIGTSTACHIVLEFCQEVWNIMRPLYLNDFPLTSEKVQTNIDGFMALGFPQCIGVLDGCHIAVRPSIRFDAVEEYCNNKGWDSTVLLALVDHRNRFVYVNVGSPGVCDNSQIFEESTLKKFLSSSSVIWENSKQIGDQNVPALIIADSAFRTAPYLMTPYPLNEDTGEAHRAFNHSLLNCGQVAETAFDHLRARFMRIGNGINNNIDNASLIIKACCAIHNFLIERNDPINEKWMEEMINLQVNRDQPEQPEVTENNADAALIRDAIANSIRDNVGLSSDSSHDAGSLVALTIERLA